MDLKLVDRHFYVTGVSRGVGRATAECLIAEGAVVHGCARSERGLEELRETLPPEVRELSQLAVVDVIDETAMASAVNTAAATVGKLDGVVACAGAGISGSSLETSNAEWSQQLNLKVLSVLNLVRPAVRWLEKSDSPRAVLINGVTAHHPETSMAAVSSARAAVSNLGRTLAMELAGRVGVTVVNLGAILTDRQRARWQRDNPGQPFESWVADEVAQRGILAGRLGDPEEAAAVVAFLLSPRASYVTGTSVDVAGGSHGLV